MLRSTLRPICPACLLLGSSSLGWSPLQGQLARQLPSQQRQLLSTTSKLRQKRRSLPSRMVLSSRVAQSPSPRGSYRPRHEGPFGGMNRTVANIDPLERERRLKSRTRSTDGRSSSKRGGVGDKADGTRDGRGFKVLKMHQSLASIGYGHRTRIKMRMQEVESFDQFDLLPAVKDAVLNVALAGMVNIKPTPIQRLAIPLLSAEPPPAAASSQTSQRRPEGGNVEAPTQSTPVPLPRQEFLLAAETGSGKTLAYLVPAVNAIKLAEARDADIISYNERRATEAERLRTADPKKHAGRAPAALSEPHPTMARPRVVVLVPTAELVDQVGGVAKSLSHLAKIRVRMISANYSAQVIESEIFSPKGLDLLVATPHLLASIADSHPNVLSRVSHLIIDESDSLFDRSFSPVTTSILDRALPSLAKIVLCSATIPRRLDNYLATRFPRMKRITTPNLHAVPRRVQLGVIDVSKEPYRNNKNLACAEAIWSIGKMASQQNDGSGGARGVDVRRVMVFVNEREKTQEVADYLSSKGIDAVALHRDTPEQRQSEMLASFTSSELLTVPAPAAAAAAAAPSAGSARKRQLSNVKVIVATDLASRGIDTLAVRDVVLYDVPHTTIDFIHRLGRAGRMGRRGKGIVLVGKDDRKDVVAEVRESMYLGQALI